MRPRRVLAVTIAAVAVMAAIASAATVRPVRLPRDHGAHLQASVEWWYTTGHARAAGGRPYFWFATIWRSPLGVVGRVNVVDLRRDRVVLARQWTSAAQPAAGARDLRAGGLRIHWLASGRYGRLHVRARLGGRTRLRLTLVAERPYALHGDRGVVPQGPTSSSDYYSNTRLAAHGRLRTGGRSRRIHGLAWFDHQWGDFLVDPSALRWDWFACQLDDGRDLMVTRFLDARGHAIQGGRHATLVGAGGRARAVHRFSIRPLGRWVRPRGARARYPLRWGVRVPGAGIHLRLRAAARRQFIPMTVLPSFWEGAADIVRGNPGICTVESSREFAAVPG